MSKRVFSFVFPKGVSSDWRKLEELLSSVMSLIRNKEERKRFNLYLSSPYLVLDGKRYALLFEYLYSKMSGGENSATRVSAVLKNVYGDSDFKKYGRSLKSDIKSLCDEILRFKSLEYYNREPAERARLSVYALSHQGLPELYKKHQEKWVGAALKLPIGSRGAYHRWASTHAGYFSLEETKTKAEQKEFYQIAQSLDGFFSLHKFLYDHEQLRYKKSKNEANSDKQQGGGNKDGEIAQLYAGLLSFMEGQKVDWAYFRQLKRLFLQRIGHIEVDHAIAIILGFENVVERQRLKAMYYDESESCFWPHFLTRTDLGNKIPPISRVTFDNHLHIFLVHKRFYLAEKFFDKFIGYVLPNERDKAKLSARISISFFTKEYLEVVRLVKEYRDKYDPRKLENSGHNQFRLHSYNIRALFYICAHMEQEEKDQELDRAIDNLKRFILKNEEFLGRNNYLERFKKFRRVCYSTLTYMRDSTYGKSKDHIKKLLNQEVAVHGKDWWLEFLDTI
ncbi:MAG: hypothetical protein AAGF87_09935 [Bacteroidota bacterium]